VAEICFVEEACTAVWDAMLEVCEDIRHSREVHWDSRDEISRREEESEASSVQTWERRAVASALKSLARPAL
jgi:hypothetical protein